MEQLLQQQHTIADSIIKIEVNFKKDPESRKTTAYLQKRLDSLNAQWELFSMNHSVLANSDEHQDHIYFKNNLYDTIKARYEALCETFRKYEVRAEAVDTGVPSKSDELVNQQRTNFRALSRIIRNIKIQELTEKWEIVDKLNALQSRWKLIDELHWQIDNLVSGSDGSYEDEFTTYETLFETTKRNLNRKLNSTSQQYQQVPTIEIPAFSGNYSQWPTFMDLYCEAIHNNVMLTKTQKMQHLKGKLKGEAERIVQHLTISADNYDTCWEILNHRYNNKQLLFSKQIQTFMGQPALQTQNAYELKRLHDTSVETIHAIHNLGIDTTTWDPILVHILSGKLDPDTYSAYMEARKAPRELPCLDELIHFLENKFTALEPVQKKKVTPNKPTQPSNKENTAQPKRDANIGNRRFPARSFHTNTEKNCPVCKNNHILLHCKSFQEMTPEDKITSIAQLHICRNCLFSHNDNKCNSNKRCRVCKDAHHTTLHDIYRSGEKQASSNAIPTKPSTSQQKANHVSGSFNEVLLATVQLQIMAADGTYVRLRCLLDQGSQINLITESAAQRLGLQRRNQNATVSGIGTSAHHSNGTVSLDCTSLYGGHTFKIDAMVMANMLSNLPNYTFEKQEWPHIQNIQLADPDYNVSRPVDILLDAGVYADIIMSGMLRGPSHAPLAQQTKVGWVLLGNIKTYNCHVLLNIDDVSRFWEMEEISEQNNNNRTLEEEYCESLFSATTTRREDGRYIVRLPMKVNFEENLGASKPQAVAQFRQLEKRLAKNESWSTSYKGFIHEYLELEHMKPCTEHREPSCFLPHHGVEKLDSTTTKLRVVFNASAKTSSGHSLNQLMEQGPNLQQDLQAMILRWRAFQYVYTADIEKFYRQILIHDDDQHLLKIIWRDAPTNLIKEYQLCTVTYGTKAAPFLAMRTIMQLVIDDGNRYPLAAEILTNQLYVDDFLGGSNNVIEAQEAQKQLIDMLKGGGFNLRKWASNHPSLLKTLPDELISQNMFNFKDAESNKTLGLSWNPHTDQFTFQAPVSNNRDVTTKRTLLSDLSKLYDPLGWLSPVTMKSKLIFQQAWTATADWDVPLPSDIKQEWDDFQNELPSINNIVIQRWIGVTTQPIELHGFCDASEKAYGCAIYCKSTNESGQHLIKLVAAKTKLAPLRKPPSLPRLELCGALLLSRLMSKVIDSINSQTVTMFGWTDSMIVLGWLHGEPSRWKTFVANRVIKITDVMPPECWRHVKSGDNAADSASRGLSPRQLAEHNLWWGPEWLKIYKPSCNETYSTNEEVKKSKQVCSTQTGAPLVESLLQDHSSMSSATRVLAWVMRFINNARDRTNAKQFSHLTLSDIENAEAIIIRTVQHNHFTDDLYHLRKHNKVQSSSKLLTLSPFVDDQGILRVQGRLQHASLDQSQKHPAILPNNNKLTELLINQAHQTTLHGGARLTLSHLRNKYWILGGLRTVKKQLLKCVRCHRFKTQQNAQQMADLPKPRVTPSRPFTHTGVDFTGQVEVKANKGRGIKTSKAYIAIFVCLSTKAVHLELVSDLTTAAFLAALKRLCARRGAPSDMYSDNGTNFVGAAKALKKEHDQALKLYINNESISDMVNCGIQWHFNAPAWASAGGLWESGVRSLKHHLKRVLGEQKLTYEEFATLLIQIEACLNSRPLVAITNDLGDLDCLTPGHFLVGGPVLSPPPSGHIDDISLTTRWKQTERMHRDFWKRWSKDYLQTLQTRGKWQYPTKNLNVNDVVLIKDDNIPPAKWLLGRVTEIHPGADGYVRVVTVKTKTNYMKRPVTKLSRLPIDNDNVATTPSVDPQPKDTHHTKTTRPLRPRKPKPILSKVLTSLLVFMTCIAPSVSQLANVAQLQPGKLMYFDKIGEVQIIQDEWKLIVYYNMSTYWQSFTNIENYVSHLNSLCTKEPAFVTIATQFQHELRELSHYNDILQSEHGRRTKRGLIDGVGYVANSLFGILDQRFADKYDKDIRLIQDNENHLLNLYKEHTSIIEGEYNLLKRNEEVMNKQFTIITQHLAATESKVQQVHDNAMYITATALAANMIVTNLRHIQQLLLDLVTDVRNGRVDTHLLKPDEFEAQLNVISGQVPKGLSLPCINSYKCTREMYKLSRVHIRLTDKFLIFEVKVPLISTEQYELTRAIPIYNVKETTMIYIQPSAEYFAVSLQKDLLMPLMSKDVSSCISLNENQLLCAANLPIYDIKTTDSICEAQIINNRAISACRTVVSGCRDEWIKLHTQGAWMFTCCKERSVRIFCPAGVTSQTLHDTGIIKLAEGCLLRGDHHYVHSHYKLQSEVKVTDDVMYMPESGINTLLSNNSNITFHPESHDEQLKTLKEKIELMKKEQETLHVQADSHNNHQYATYGILILCGAIIGIGGALKMRKQLQKHRSHAKSPQGDNNASQGEQGGVNVDHSHSIELHSTSKRVDTASSPCPTRVK